MSAEPPKIIIRAPLEDAEDGAHSGAWKVAYADFMTALMAFFLLMWILSTTEDKKLEGLAEFFTPTYDHSKGIGGEGAFGGTAPERHGLLAQRVKELPKGDATPRTTPADPTKNPWSELDLSDPLTPETENAMATPRPLYMPGHDTEPSFAERQNGTPFDGDGRGALERLALGLQQDLSRDPALAELAESVQVELVEAGLEMRILDREDVPMFAVGATRFTQDVAALVAALGTKIAAMAHPISITGHTDARPFVDRADYSNWELSTDRANATRRALIKAGVSAERFASVSGVADTDPLLPNQPLHPSNRRITVHLQMAPSEAE